MTKAALLILGLATLLALPAALAQDSSATAVNEAVLRQANQIVLRNKLADAKAAAQRGDIPTAARLYQESVTLAHAVGSGVDTEAARAMAGLVGTRLALARDAQSRGDLREAATQVNQVLKADPKNSEAISFKQGNERLAASYKGQIPDADTVAKLPQIYSQKTEARTLVQDGKVLYEAGQLNEAEVKLKQAIKLDGDNAAAFYYLSLIRDSKFARASAEHTVDTQARMAEVEKHWVLPSSASALPVPNPYAATDRTGSGRQSIIAKMNKIRFQNLAFEGVPLNEALRILAKKTLDSDPEHKGINFILNNTAGGSKVDPATGLSDDGGDFAAFTVKLNLTDVSLKDALDALLMVAQNPAKDGRIVKFSIMDYAIMFQLKGAETPPMFMRTFRVDPNTFYSGLASVSSTTLNSGGGSSGGNNSGGNNKNSNNNNNNNGGGNNGGGNNGGGVIGMVNAFGGGARAGGAGDAGGGGNIANQNGLNYITSVTMASTPSEAARTFFATLGVNLKEPAGKSVFFNDRLGLLFVKSTEADLDIIERAIQVMNQVAPQVHIKSRFIEVNQDDGRALGFDWSLGKFNMGGNNSVVGNAGSSYLANPSTTTSGGTTTTTSGSSTINTPVTVPFGSTGSGSSTTTINGTTTTTTTTQPTMNVGQLFSSGLDSTTAGATAATITGILTQPQFAVTLHALQTRSGVETLAEPELTTISGRQAQMRATVMESIITGVNVSSTSSTSANNNNNGGVSTGTSLATITYDTTSIELGPVLDVVPYVLSDGYTINLALIPQVTTFLGYNQDAKGLNTSVGASTSVNIGYVQSPVILPSFQVRQVVSTVNVWDNQTVVIGGLISSEVSSTKNKVPMLGDIPLLGTLFQSQSKTTNKKNLMIFVTATIVDPAGNRAHSDDELPFAQSAIPTQPPGAGQFKEIAKEVRSLPAANP